MLAPPSLRAVHPLGKSPVITDGATTVAESGAIVEYLVERFGGGRLIPPAGSADRLRYTYWLHYAEGSAMPPLLLKLVFDRIASAPMPWPVSAIARGIAGEGAEHIHRPAAEAALGFHGVRTRARSVVRGSRVHGGRCANELSARGGCIARRTRCRAAHD
jgi:glutathione S-transferase